MTRTLVLGGGFGGLTIATELKRKLGTDHDVVLVNRAEHFSMGLRKLWELVGHATNANGSRSRDAFGDHGIRVVRGDVEEIDPLARTVKVKGETIESDSSQAFPQRPRLWRGSTEAASSSSSQARRILARPRRTSAPFIRAIFAESELDFDLLIAVPPHRAPGVVKASGLAGEGEWIAVHPETLTTSHANVFAIGDVTQIPLADGLPLPKAGVIAELQGMRVAAAIAADLNGGKAPPPFNGTGACFIEMGTRLAALVEGNWYAEPQVAIAARRRPRRREARVRERAARALVRCVAATGLRGACGRSYRC